MAMTMPFVVIRCPPRQLVGVDPGTVDGAPEVAVAFKSADTPVGQGWLGAELAGLRDEWRVHQVEPFDLVRRGRFCVDRLRQLLQGCPDAIWNDIVLRRLHADVDA